MKGFIGIAGLLCVMNAQASDNPASDLMLISKMTGICGVMFQMAQFQDSTQMPGGAEFIQRFWTTEFARLGKTQEQFLKECQGSIAIYEQYKQSLEATSSGTD